MYERVASIPQGFFGGTGPFDRPSRPPALQEEVAA